MKLLQPYYNQFEVFCTQQSLSKAPHNLYAPIEYIMNSGGKRLRPILTLIGHHLFNQDYEQSLPIAFGVELFHNFSLVHDDIMDEAPLRRNIPTVHHKFGVNNGILSGDLMLVLVYQYLNTIKDYNKLGKVLKVFNEAAVKVCEGQQMDMDFETMEAVSIHEYISMIGAKTAALLAASLGMGAIMGGAKETDFKHAFEFGYNAGVAFQLQDDILDTFGDPTKFGKKVGGDIAQNKKTFLILKGLEVADTQSRSRLEYYLANEKVPEDEKITAVTSILDTLNIQELAEVEKEKFHTKALNHLEQINGSETQKNLLGTLSNQLLTREV